MNSNVESFIEQCHKEKQRIGRFRRERDANSDTGTRIVPESAAADAKTDTAADAGCDAGAAATDAATTDAATMDSDDTDLDLFRTDLEKITKSTAILASIASVEEFLKNLFKQAKENRAEDGERLGGNEVLFRRPEYKTLAERNIIIERNGEPLYEFDNVLTAVDCFCNTKSIVVYYQR